MYWYDCTCINVYVSMYTHDYLIKLLVFLMINYGTSNNSHQIFTFLLRKNKFVKITYSKNRHL